MPKLKLKPWVSRDVRVSVLLAAEDLARIRGECPEDILKQFKDREEYIFLAVVRELEQNKLPPDIRGVAIIE